jgi:hypothetical protein
MVSMSCFSYIDSVEFIIATSSEPPPIFFSGGGRVESCNAHTMNHLHAKKNAQSKEERHFILIGVLFLELLLPQRDYDI